MVCILLDMSTPAPSARTHRIIGFALVMCVAVWGACFGLLLGWTAAVLAVGSTALGAGIGSFLAHRQMLAFLRSKAVPVDGYAEGITDGVLVNIATYRAAVFPLIPGGVSWEERAARRDVAYQLSALDSLPLPVRVSAAAALEAIDQGLDVDRAQAAMDALSFTVYKHRNGR